MTCITSEVIGEQHSKVLQNVEVSPPKDRKTHCKVIISYLQHNCLHTIQSENHGKLQLNLKRFCFYSSLVEIKNSEIKC